MEERVIQQHNSGGEKRGGQPAVARVVLEPSKALGDFLIEASTKVAEAISKLRGQGSRGGLGREGVDSGLRIAYLANRDLTGLVGQEGLDGQRSGAGFVSAEAARKAIRFIRASLQEAAANHLYYRAGDDRPNGTFQRQRELTNRALVFGFHQVLFSRIGLYSSSLISDDTIRSFLTELDMLSVSISDSGVRNPARQSINSLNTPSREVLFPGSRQDHSNTRETREKKS